MPWWEPLVANVLVGAAAVICILTFFFSMSLMGCEDSPYACPELTQSLQAGSVHDIRIAIHLFLGLALAVAVAVPFLAGRVHFLVVWPIAAIPLVIGIVTIAWATGVAPSPWGQL